MSYQYGEFDGWPGTYWLEKTCSFAQKVSECDQEYCKKMRQHLKNTENDIHKNEEMGIYRAKMWWLDLYASFTQALCKSNLLN